MKIIKNKRCTNNYFNKAKRGRMAKLRKELQNQFIETPMLWCVCATDSIKSEMKRRIKARINLLTEGEMITLLKRINSSILWEGEELAFNWEVYAMLRYNELSL